jgi:hypothetical protein
MVDQPSLPLSLVSPIDRPQQSSHTLPTSAPSPLVALIDDALAQGPSIASPRHLTAAVNAASNTKAPTGKKTRKSIAISTLGTVCKDSATVAVARALEVLHAKAGMVFHSPDAQPNLEHRLFTQRDEQFLDVDVTFSMYPTIDQLPQGFWPMSSQYTSAAAGGHRVRCLFCSWSFTGTHVKANFRGHVRCHWKLAAALQKANSSATTNVQIASDLSASSPGPSASSTVAKVLKMSGDVLPPDDAGSSKLGVVPPSKSSEFRHTQNDQVMPSASTVTDRQASQERKRSHAEAFSEEDTRRCESTPATRKSPYHPVMLSIARALSSIRGNPRTILIPPEHSMSYEELSSIADCYFDIDKAVARYPLVDQLPDQFWPSDEAFKKVEASGELESLCCPFCTSSFKGSAAKQNMQIHFQCHWWHASGQSSSETPDNTLTTNTESVGTTYTGSSPIRPPKPVRPLVRAKTNSEKKRSTVTRTDTDPEVNIGNHGTHPPAKRPRLQSTTSNPMTQRAQALVCFIVI